MGGYGGRNTRSGGNRNQLGNPGNKSGSGNDESWGEFCSCARDLRNNEDVITSIILICFLLAYALFDSGSSHTFISARFAS